MRKIIVAAVLFILTVTTVEFIAWYAGMDIFKRGSGQVTMLLFSFVVGGMVAAWYDFTN